MMYSKIWFAQTVEALLTWRILIGVNLVVHMSTFDKSVHSVTIQTSMEMCMHKETNWYYSLHWQTFLVLCGLIGCLCIKMLPPEVGDGIGLPKFSKFKVLK